MTPIIRKTAGLELSALFSGAGEPAASRFLEFFTVNIRNRNTRAAYARAAGAFLRWCQIRAGLLELREVQPVHAAACIEELQAEQSSAPAVTQRLAGIRMLLDCLVTGQAVPSSPARVIRGPRYPVSEGVTPVLSSGEATTLLADLDTSTVVALRDRAIIAVMAYTFARVGAVVALILEHHSAQNKCWWLRLRGKKGMVTEMPRHKLEENLNSYINAAGIREARSGPLFGSPIGKTDPLTVKSVSRTDVWYVARRRGSEAGSEAAIGCHTFRATGIADHLTNGGRVEVAQRVAGHSNTEATDLYDRRDDDVSVGEAERIGI